MKIKNKELFISKCVLPGADPHDMVEKTCQDDCIYIKRKDCILLALYDGHGNEGEKVSKACIQKTTEYFKATKKDNPAEFLQNLALKCDTAVKDPSSGIDVSNSGSTAAMVLLQGNELTNASVGDSRAIIATQTPPEELPARPSALNATDAQLLADIKVKRSTNPSVKYRAVQLTQDQKPEDPKEMQRIKQHGGRVEQIKDVYGQDVGPFRVWKGNTTMPGIAMSRSIGDVIGSELGVIAEPIVTNYTLTEG